MRADPVGGRMDCGGDVGIFPRDDDMVRAIGTKVAFVGGKTGGGDHGGTRHPAQLQRRCPGGRRPRRCQNVGSGSGLGNIDHGVEGRHVLHPDRGRFDGAQALGRRGDVAGIDHSEISAGARVVVEIRQRAIALPHGDAFDTGTNLIDDPGRLHPDPRREPGKAEGIAVEHQVHVAPVEGEGLDPQADFPRPGRAQLAILQHQTGVAVVAVDHPFACHRPSPVCAALGGRGLDHNARAEDLTGIEGTDCGDLLLRR